MLTQQTHLKSAHGTIQPKRSNARILALINKTEAEQFFESDVFDQLLEQENFTWIEDTTENELAGIIKQLKPQIIMGAWSTPRLPLIDGRLPVELYCHICGSVRNQITRDYLESGLRVTNWGNSVAQTVAESALMLALAALRNVGYHIDSIHYKNGWKHPDSPPQKSLIQASIGIHGMGQIAQALIQLLKPFEANISVYDPYVARDIFTAYGVRRVENLDLLFQTSEVLFECCALTPETEGIVTKERIEMLPKDATFVNIGRGHLVDEAALSAAIENGQIRAGLDVYRKEPLPKNSALRGLPGLIGIPHLGGNNQKVRHNAGRVALQNIEAFLNGTPLTNEINVEQYDLMT